ncbi:MAG TPA: rhodanese-like domain-containing protein [Flavobacteriales bacterium]|nr:rhodanese-like domain-containing protein [Flavobacteriales bacterium]
MSFSQDQINKDVDVATFRSYVDKEKGLVLDVRTADEVKEGYIKGAKNVDYFSDEFEAEIKKLPLDKPVYVYCRSGNRSGQAAADMKKWGFKEVYNLNGGITAWQEKGNKMVVPK